ncbi:phage portal protein [Xanthobacteraceae bacterium Astr-EGSB]|uniref:phage portal protein n=1 Tax=Astrobacterium formosum TaxID=3069710 RepID=UPI0027B42A73|nr:phage portal protein [Xanthobacteraceae bacterium Astr-EGSB]
MDLNLLERAIAQLAPGWGVGRLHAKASLAEARLHARAYDAARRDRRTESWRATGGSANAEMAPALDLIRRRSRDLCRNNEWAINAKRKFVAHAVGIGITPRPKDDEKTRAKKAARDAWDAFNENCDPEGMADFYALQARAAGEAFEGGAAFVRWYMRPSEFGLRVPLQCEVLEHEFLDTRKTEILDAGRGNVVVHGVEYDRYGRRVAYWLFPEHPGEVSIIRRGAFRSVRVPADECDHVFRVDRAGQVTGIPWLAPSMLRLRDAGDTEEAEIVRRKIAACLTVFVRRSGVGPGSLAQSVDQKTDAKGRRLEKIAPGLITYLQDNEEIQTTSPSPVDGLVDFMSHQLYGFSAGVGLPYSMTTGDLSDANYSSQREGKIDFYAVLDQWQMFMLVPQICRPAWRRVMRVSAARGLQVSPDIRADHALPKRPWVDPVKDLKAEAMELALGLDSWAEKVAARGYDPETLLKEIKEWRAKLEAAGLSPMAAAGIAGAGGGAKTGQEGGKKPAKDDSKDGDDDATDE